MSRGSRRASHLPLPIRAELVALAIELQAQSVDALVTRVDHALEHLRRRTIGRRRDDGRHGVQRCQRLAVLALVLPEVSDGLQ
jgi:hypothetical protein